VSRRQEWAAITLILLLGAALRLWGLGAVPPGLAHDEVANWLIAQDILAGHHAIYFTAAYGHEPLYQYVQAASVALFGDHWLGLRWPSVAFGLLGIAVTYTLTRRLFDVPVALLTIAWLATSFWPLFYARVALRAITLPFTAALAAYILLRATNSPTSQSTAPGVINLHSPFSIWLLAGLFLGLSLYTYMAARILPFIIAAFLIYLFLIHSSTPIPWSHLLVFFLVAAVVSAPLVIWLTTHPGAEYRIAEVRKPLDRLLAGDPSLVWQNLSANLEFLTFAGDPWPRQNLPGRPVFADPISAALFYAGLAIALWRWRDPRYGFLLIWLAGALVPSIVTSDAPSSIRDILGLVVVFVFPALALVEAGHWLKRRMQDARCRMQDARYSTQVRRFLLPASCFLLLASCFLLLAPCLFLTVRDYFSAWPRHDVVRFDYQADLTAVAHRLDELPPGAPVTVAGLSVHTMDGPSLRLAAQRDVHEVRLCDTRETLIVPAGRDAWLFVPRVVPFDVDLQERLLGWGAVVEADSQHSFASYRLSDDAVVERDLQRLETTATLPDGSPVGLPVSFDGRLAFLGYEWTREILVPGDSLTLLTYWRVQTPGLTPLKVFVHLLGESEMQIAQHDGLGSPPRGWAAGDLIVQKHVLPLPVDISPGLYKPQLGVYNAPAGPRLSAAGADRLILSPIDVNVPSEGKERSYSSTSAYLSATWTRANCVRW
jgi:4-amino-4-deoxy-L-arabinose transferase-like glycosyltransferase